jgi:hypothetical protein
MLDSFAPYIAWVLSNKEWLFSGAGVALFTLIGSAIVLLWRRSRKPAATTSTERLPAGGHVTTRKSVDLSSVFCTFICFYRWLVRRVRSLQSDFAEKDKRLQKRLYHAMGESTVFFSDRFTQAFPGCRNVLLIDDPAEAVRRLDILLQKPLSVKVDDGPFGASPIWWFRGGQNLPINSYRRIKNRIFFPTNDIMFDEIILHRVRRLAAFGSMAYWATAVYLETDGVPPSGLYDYGPSEYAKERGYDYEEVGAYKGRFIKREEYDDGAAVIDGKVVRTLGKAKLQVRYLSTYNFFIIPIASPINDNRYDRMFDEAMKAVLEKKMTIKELAGLVRKLPRNPKEDRMSQRVEANLATL